MNRNIPVATIIVFAIGLACLASDSFAADKKDVKLTLTVSGGSATITVDPVDAWVWRKKANKPKKINWKTINISAHSQLFWEIRYDPSKGGGTADYFGDVDIACGESEKKVQPDKKPDFPYAQWPYSITVFSCVDGNKGEELASVDPRIIWKD